MELDYWMWYRYITYRSSVSGDGSDNKQEIESDNELERESLAGANGRNRNSTGHVGMENTLESKASTNGGWNLCCNVGWDLDPREVTQYCKRNGEGWV